VRYFFREYGLPLLLLAVSAVTTTANGARFMQNFVQGMPPVVRESDLWPWGWLAGHPSLFVTGWTFALALLGILLIHEFGHYFACRAHRISATLPWVLPAPTLSGTVGAVIQLRSRFPSRDALMDVGIYGPLAGYVASAVAVAVGFVLSFHSAANAPAAIVVFGSEPLTIRLLHALLAHWNPSIPAYHNIAPHPVLVAGWIGLFIT
jgi:membrane-associated protease RseP (regulator of RpoE activity)